jgi:putative ABC transport system permease protein
MRVLDRKLIRDMKRLWAQSLAVALVMASGVATMLIGIGAYTSLSETREAYYSRNQFADIFATVERAPQSLLNQIREIDGVAHAETRIMKSAILDIGGFELPATGLFISLPRTLNQLYLREGRLPEADEVIVNESFAKAHGFVPGSSFQAILNGAKRRLTISGIALSPEFIYALGPGDMMPDDRRFGVVWMKEKPLAAVFDLDGAFNSVTLRLLKGASATAVIQRLDHLLMPYGGDGAHERKDQLSHAFVSAELKQLATMSRILPPVFLLVTAFLINMVLSRLITLEREQIGLFKAIGYGPLAISFHYVKLVVLMCVVGVSIGFAAGTWLAFGITRLYADFFHFPYQIFIITPSLFAVSGAVAVAAALAGALRAVYAAASLAPAIAMQPPTPPSYRRYLGFAAPFSQLTIMILRHIMRWPLRAAITTAGIALPVGLLVTSLFALGAVDFMIDATFERADRQDASIMFGAARASGALEAVRRLPGVIAAEPYRAVQARLVSGHHQKRVVILGKPRSMELSRVLDLNLDPVVLPQHGLALSQTLADILHARQGDSLHVEFLGRNPGEADVPVTSIIQSYVGLMAFMDMAALDRLLGERPSISGVHVILDDARTSDFYRAVKQKPALSALALQRISLSRFRETIAENISIQVIVYTALATIVAFGVVYNSARIQFAERARELASLRVLGFSEFEVSRVLLGEIAILTIIAVPFGWAMGVGLAWLLTQGFQSELYRLPFIIYRSTYAHSALIVIAAVVVSTLVVRRRVGRLDLVSVLKTRD